MITIKIKIRCDVCNNTLTISRQIGQDDPPDISDLVYPDGWGWRVEGGRETNFCSHDCGEKLEEMNL